MRKSFLASSIFALAAMAIAMMATTADTAESAKIAIKGSTTVLPITRKAIGYIGFGYLDRNIKALTVNGIEPSFKNAKAKKNPYPIARKLFMYVNEAKYSPHAKSFVNYLLGRKGQDVVKAAGYIPL